MCISCDTFLTVHVENVAVHKIFRRSFGAEKIKYRRFLKPSGRWFASLRPIFDSRNNIFVSKILFSVRVSIIFNLIKKMRKRVDRKFRIRYDRKNKKERKGGRTMLQINRTIFIFNQISGNFDALTQSVSRLSGEQ